MRFKEKLVAIRKRLGVSQRGLGRRLGVSHSTIIRLEAGRTQPTYMVTKALDSLYSELFGVPNLPDVPEHFATPNRDLKLDLSNIIESAKKAAVSNINITLVQRNYLIGKRIEEEILTSRSEDYGKEIIKNLSVFLTEKYGKGFNKTDLYSHVRFYRFFPNIFPSVSGKSFPHMCLRKERKSGASVHQ